MPTPVYYPQTQTIYEQQPYPVYVPQQTPVYYQQPVYQPTPTYYQQPVYSTPPVDQSVYLSSAYYTQNQSGALTVSCSPAISYSNVGGPVSWTSNVSGGIAPYHYSWGGTDNPADQDSPSINVFYQSPGVKDLTVSVTSADGQTVSSDCGTVSVQ